MNHSSSGYNPTFKMLLKKAGVKDEKEFLKKFPTEESFFQAFPEMEMLRGGASYQDGGMAVPQESPQDMQEQIIQFIIQSLQNGDAPEDILGSLVEQGIPEEQAAQIIQVIVQKIQEEQAGAEEMESEMEEEPEMEMGMQMGGMYFGSPQEEGEENKPVMKKGGSYSGTYNAGVYFRAGGYIPNYSEMNMGGSFDNPGFSSLPISVQKKIMAASKKKYVGGGAIDDCPEGYVYDESIQQCVPDTGYNPAQEASKNQPAVPVVNKMGQTVGGPASTGTNTGGRREEAMPFTVTGPKQSRLGKFLGKAAKPLNKLAAIGEYTELGLNLGNAIAQGIQNKKVQNQFESSQRNKLFTGQLRNPGKEFTMGNVETQSGVQFPGSMTPPNEGMFSNAFYGQMPAQFGGFVQPMDGKDSKVRMGYLESMKYGGQFEGSYGLDVGWRNLYTDMAKTSSDYATQAVSKKKNPKEPYVLEAEGGETLYKPSDEEFYNINGKRHSEGGVPLTESQVSSKNSEEPSFIFSDTKKMKIKDKNILDYFGVSKKKGGVTPAAISKKYDLNKYKAILEDPNKDPLAKNTAMMMLERNKKRLSELAAIQEKMKGLDAPEFAQRDMMDQESMEGMQPMAKYGGRLFKFQPGGSYDPEFLKAINWMTDYEQAGSAAGPRGYIGGGTNWGTNDPSITSKEAAIKYYYDNYWPMVKDLPPGLRTRALQMAVNTGDPYGEILVAGSAFKGVGPFTLDDRRKAVQEAKDQKREGLDKNKFILDKRFKENKADIEAAINAYKANPEEFLQNLDFEQDRYYNRGLQDMTDDQRKFLTGYYQGAGNIANEYVVPENPYLDYFAGVNNVSSSALPAPPLSGPSVVNQATGSAPVVPQSVSTGNASRSAGATPPRQSSKVGSFSTDYETLNRVLMSPENEPLRKTIYEKYKAAHPGTKVSQDEYFKNLLNAQEQFYAINEAYKDNPKYLKEKEWDRKKGGRKNKRYREEAKKLGFNPLSEQEIGQFQEAYRDLQDAAQDPTFFESFGRHFQTDPRGLADQTYRGKPISPVDAIAGNTTIGQLFRAAKPEPEEFEVTTTTTLPPPPGKKPPKYVCLPDGKGGGTVVESESGIGYDTKEEAGRHCGEPVKKPPFDYLLPDKLNMLATSAIFPEIIMPFNPEMAYSPRGLNLEDWRAKAAQRFSTQYAAPSAQLAQYTSPQGLAANLSMLAGQTAQQMAGEDIAPTISRNVDRVNQYTGDEAKRQDEINLFNLGQRQKRYEGSAVARQQYDNALREYLKQNSDAFTRAWNNRMELGMINDTNKQYYMDPRTGRQVFYNPAGFAGVTGSSTGSNADLGTQFNNYYTEIYDQLKSTKMTDEQRAKEAANLANMKIRSSREYETETDGKSSRRRSRFKFD